MLIEVVTQNIGYGNATIAEVYLYVFYYRSACIYFRRRLLEGFHSRRGLGGANEIPRLIAILIILLTPETRAME